MYPGNEGYSLMLRGRNGEESETVRLPYEVSTLPSWALIYGINLFFVYFPCYQNTLAALKRLILFLFILSGV